jgi:GntR family transcriptional regulator
MVKRSDKQNAAPAVHPFHRLQGELAELIASTPDGDRLQAEPELAKQLGVSRATLREAMRSFEGQGLIRRRQGVGTFVVKQSQVIETGLERLESIESMASKIGLVVAMGDLRIDEIRANLEQSEKLQVDLGSPLVKVSRVILAEKRPVAYLIDILPAEILTPAELQAGFTGSVLDLLLRRGSPQLTNSIAEIHAVATSVEVSRELEIQRGDVLLMFSARLYSTTNQVVDLSYSYFLPGYFNFHVVRRVGETNRA